MYFKISNIFKCFINPTFHRELRFPPLQKENSTAMNIQIFTARGQQGLA